MSNQSNSVKIGTPIAIVVAGLLISAGLFFGLQEMNVGTDTDGTTAGVQTSPGPSTVQPTEAPSIVQVSIDDDPVLGDPNAPVTVIEFSDYECPYCKRSFQQMIPDLTEQYIDTGKVKLVFRDLPLYFHDPAATKNAVAANCARAQGDDSTYYEYHDLLFENTGSNGAGIPDEKMVELAEGIGLDGDEFSTCVEEERYLEEVQNDLADAQAAGANGTPTYFVGSSTADGVIDGEIVVGAVPFATIKGVIDQYIK